MTRSLAQRFWLVIAVATIAIILGWIAEFLLSAFRGWPFGHTQYGHLAGWFGLSWFLLAFYYSIKKRFGRRNGWSKLWFWVHQIAAVVGALIIFVHSGIHFHALVPSLALIVMVLVVISGLIGIFVHRKAIRLLGDTRKEMVKQGLTEDEISVQLFELAVHEKNYRLWRKFHVPLAMVFAVLIVLHIGGALYFGGL